MEEKDLSDFGAGNQRELGPEQEVMVDLSRWLRSAGADTYWNEASLSGEASFRVEGTRKTPDFLIEGNANTYAVEVKDCSDSSKVHDGVAETIEYWRELNGGGVEYVAGGKAKEIDAVLLATQMSKRGHLFKKEKAELRTGTDEGGRYRAYESGQLPKNEYTATETAVRCMWRVTKGYDEESKLGIGALLSNVLDDEDEMPSALYKVHTKPKTERFSQIWKTIPVYHDY